MKRTDELKAILEDRPEHQEILFTRGYLVTNKKLDDLSTYPFYNNWIKKGFGSLSNGSNVNIYHHKSLECNTYQEGRLRISILGHAYNPFTMKYEEEEILKDCVEAYKKNTKIFFELVSELTGIHLIILNDGEKIIAVQDCSGMKSCYFGRVNSDIFLTSHPQLVSDIENLKVDEFVNALTNAWFYRKTSQYLPGNLSPYNELKRLGPNTFIQLTEKFRIERFYPNKAHPELKPEQHELVIKDISEIINRNIKLCTLKWSNTAISLSGGMDSKTTMACANGLYDKFKYYSFHSKPSELDDAKVAHAMCKEFDLEHKIYEIPNNNDFNSDYELIKKIITHNASYVEIPRDNEIRKFIYLHDLKDFEVELKSWISETGRVTWERRHGVKLPKTMTPRILSILQSRYFGAPILLKKSELSYSSFLKEVALEKSIYNYEHSDLLYWELRWGSWGSNVVTVQDMFYSTVTMPMNNRKLMDMFLWFPHKYRKADMVHSAVIMNANLKMAKQGRVVHNEYLSNKRQIIEKAYYYYRTILKWIYL